MHVKFLDPFLQILLCLHYSAKGTKDTAKEMKHNKLESVQDGAACRAQKNKGENFLVIIKLDDQRVYHKMTRKFTHIQQNYEKWKY